MRRTSVASRTRTRDGRNYGEHASTADSFNEEGRIRNYLHCCSPLPLVFPRELSEEASSNRVTHILFNSLLVAPLQESLALIPLFRFLDIGKHADIFVYYFFRINSCNIENLCSCIASGFGCRKF